MPRTKKPYGTAVNPRNGRQLELADEATGLSWFVLPSRRPPWSPDVVGALDALRADPVSQVLTVVDGPVILRWLDSLDRATRALRRADRKPVVFGGNGQLTEHPSYATAAKMVATAERCEAQLGVGALHRARLGLTITQAQKSLADLNAGYVDGGDDDDDDLDPRAIPGDVER